MSGKPWICHRWRPGSGLGKELHGGLALAADVHMDSCMRMDRVWDLLRTETKTGRGKSSPAFNCLKGAVKKMESKIFPQVHSERCLRF